MGHTLRTQKFPAVSAEVSPASRSTGRIHRLLHTGRNEVIDADLSSYFGEIPDVEL